MLSCSSFWLVPWATNDLIAKFVREHPSVPFLVRGGQFVDDQPTFLVVRMRQAPAALGLSLHVAALPSSVDPLNLDAVCAWAGVDAEQITAHEKTIRDFFRAFERDALLIAIDKSDVAAVQHAVRMADVDLNRGAPLPRSISTRSLAIVECLIDHAVPLTQVNEFGHSALWVACAGADIQLLELLERRGATFADDDEIASALVASSRRGAIDCVQFLCAKKFVHALNRRDADGDLAVLAATRNNHGDTLAVLLRAGAQLLPCLRSQKSPLAIATHGRLQGRALQAILTWSYVPQRELDQLASTALDVCHTDMLLLALAAGGRIRTDRGSLAHVDVRANALCLLLVLAAFPELDLEHVLASSEPASDDVRLVFRRHTQPRPLWIDAFPAVRVAEIDAMAHRVETELAQMREQMVAPQLPRLFVDMAIALEPLGMPVDQTIMIFDELAVFADALPLIKKWKLACAVKHFKRGQ
jgi:hypothetical protein